MEPAEHQPIQFDPLQSAVELSLAKYFEQTIEIAGSTLLTDAGRRNRIWRCQLRATNSCTPSTVIVKQVNPDGYAPNNPQAWDTYRFFQDWAGAQFLSNVAGDAGHGPAFYGGSVDHGCIVLEDLGAHASLVEPLLGSEAAIAREALVAFANRLGRMHAATIGKHEIYNEIRHKISSKWVEMEAGSRSSSAVEQERAHQVAEFVDLCRRLGVEPADAGTREFESLIHKLAEPGPLLAFIHGDPCPDNIFFSDGNLRLIDFEFSGFGHALGDGLYGRLPFPTCWCANAVPRDVTNQMEDTYRQELSHACPEILDDDRFAQEVCAVTTRQAFAGLQLSVNNVAEHDTEWGIASNRARVLTRVEVFLESAQIANQLPALTDTYTKILTELHLRWPDASPLPLYPAFRS